MTPDTADTDSGLRERFYREFVSSLDLGDLASSDGVALRIILFIEAELRALKERCKAAVPPEDDFDNTLKHGKSYTTAEIGDFMSRVSFKEGHNACRTATLQAIDNVEI